MSGELCGPRCGFCGMCDADYRVLCERCHDEPVTFPETDVYCAACVREMEAEALRIQQKPGGSAREDAA